LAATQKVSDGILAKAFTGDLVVQCISDEPASVLLDRIKSTVSQKPKKPPTGKRKTAKEPQSLSA